MRFKNPFGMVGYIEVGAVYNVTSTKKFALSGSGDVTMVEEAKWDSFKTIDIVVAVQYNLVAHTVMKLGEGKFGFSARWSATFGDSGIELSQDGAQPKIHGSNAASGELVAAASARLSESKPAAKIPFVEMAVMIGAGAESAGLEAGLQVGAFSVSASGGADKIGGAREFSLRINLDVERPAPKPAKLELAKISSGLLRPDTITCDANNSLSSKGKQVLYSWAKECNDHQFLGFVLATGMIPFDVNVFASTKQIGDGIFGAIKKELMKGNVFGSSVLKPKYTYKVKKDKGAEAEIIVDASKARAAGEKALPALPK